MNLSACIAKFYSAKDFIWVGKYMNLKVEKHLYLDNFHQFVQNFENVLSTLGFFENEPLNERARALFQILRF